MRHALLWLALAVTVGCSDKSEQEKSMVGAWKRTGPAYAAGETRTVELAFLSNGAYALVDYHYKPSKELGATLHERGQWDLEGVALVLIREHKVSNYFSGGGPAIDEAASLKKTKMTLCTATSLTMDALDGNDPTSGGDPWVFERQ